MGLRHVRMSRELVCQVLRTGNVIPRDVRVEQGIPDDAMLKAAFVDEQVGELVLQFETPGPDCTTINMLMVRG